MELCYACEDIPAPPYHSFVSGGVKSPHGWYDHKYYRDGNHVVCLTPGQFWFMPDHANGDKIRAMMEIAPDIVRRVENTSFLSGREDEVYERLKIRYEL
jgi:hypothetical protein